MAHVKVTTFGQVLLSKTEFGSTFPDAPRQCSPSAIVGRHTRIV